MSAERDTARRGPSRTRPTGAEPRELLAWYRERDGDEQDLHRRYVRAKYQMARWSDADLSRFHRYRRSVSREQAAQLVIARRYAIRGLTAAALAALVGGLLYAAVQWWRRRSMVETPQSSNTTNIRKQRSSSVVSGR